MLVKGPQINAKTINTLPGFFISLRIIYVKFVFPNRNKILLNICAVTEKIYVYLQ